MAGPTYWRAAEPKPGYDVVIVGGGGHGLSTAYYLAKNHGITNVCVLEKGWLAGGNVARNTTVIRSNYLWDESSAIYEHSLKLWEGLEEDLGSDLQFSQRGVLNLAHSLGDVRSSMRRLHANRLSGIDAEWLGPEDVKAFCPIINTSPDVRYPVLGATLQRRGGTARHDKVAWAYAARERARRRHRRALRGDGVPPRGRRARRGRSDHEGGHRGRQGRARRRGPHERSRRDGRLRLPVQSHPLQALVSVLLEPVLGCVVMSNAVHVYVSQADKGELVMGAGIDPYNGYAQRGSFHVIEHQLAAAIELFPVFAHAKLLRTWGGIVDVCPDASPILSRTPIENLYLNCGWGTGGFKATPGSGWVFADLVARGEPGPWPGRTRSSASRPAR